METRKRKNLGSFGCYPRQKLRCITRCTTPRFFPCGPCGRTVHSSHYTMSETRLRTVSGFKKGLRQKQVRTREKPEDEWRWGEREDEGEDKVAKALHTLHTLLPRTHIRRSVCRNGGKPTSTRRQAPTPPPVGYTGNLSGGLLVLPSLVTEMMGFRFSG